MSKNPSKKNENSSETGEKENATAKVAENTANTINQESGNEKETPDVTTETQKEMPDLTTEPEKQTVQNATTETSENTEKTTEEEVKETPEDNDRTMTGQSSENKSETAEMKHKLTQEDIDKNPELKAMGKKAGDTILLTVPVISVPGIPTLALKTEKKKQYGTKVTHEILKKFPALNGAAKIGDIVYLPGDEVPPVSEEQQAEAINNPPKPVIIDKKSKEPQKPVKKEFSLEEFVDGIAMMINHRNTETSLPIFTEKEILEHVRKSVGSGVSVKFTYPLEANEKNEDKLHFHGKIHFDAFGKEIIWPEGETLATIGRY